MIAYVKVLIMVLNRDELMDPYVLKIKPKTWPNAAYIVNVD